MTTLNDLEKKTLENILKKSRRNNELLTFEEVLCDRNLTTKLLKENARMQEIVALSQSAQKHKNIQARLRKLLREFRGQQEEIVVEIFCRDKNFFLSELLLQRFLKICQENDFEFSFSKGDSVVLNIAGIGALERFQQEKGKFTGIKKDNSEDVLVFVYPSIKKEDYAFSDSDVKTEFFHSSGAGGQNVNKVATSVRVTHLKSNITAVCQDERSQLQNKNRAVKLLGKKVEAHYEKLFLNELKQQKTNQKKQMTKAKMVIDFKDLSAQNPFNGGEND